PDADWVDAVGAHEPAAELTTVGTDLAVVHQGTTVRRHPGLTPDTPYELDGFSFRTLPAPGERLATFATVNDVHFGEEVCGVIEGTDIGPVFRVGPGEDPYPEVMNRGAVAEITALDPDAVIVKGDLTSRGAQSEYDEFLAAYEPAFGERLHVVRGNHESYNHATFASEPTQLVTLPGVEVAILDTSVDGSPAGTVSTDQLDWLDDLATNADRPVLVFGHHHLGDAASSENADRTFGIDLEASDALLAVVARRPRIRGYFAGHTHRNRVRRFAPTGERPWVEVACVKDYPGAWAEYQVYDGGIVQVEHRISSREALAWTEQTRHMYAGLYHDYAFGSLADRCFTIPVT
ncbi:MAG TPA: metallophosphoesterase, partial [Acidimicrobiales bacterium]